mmetsp:Transcript_38034/g.90365  ORF Transcript_38034/g.90365 Transcript_38034/m.90365 type:complete len:223 (-) Transcript_38034:714-1382(-)
MEPRLAEESLELGREPGVLRPRAPRLDLGKEPLEAGLGSCTEPHVEHGRLCSVRERMAEVTVGRLPNLFSRFLGGVTALDRLRHLRRCLVEDRLHARSDRRKRPALQLPELGLVGRGLRVLRVGGDKRDALVEALEHRKEVRAFHGERGRVELCCDRLELIEVRELRPQCLRKPNQVVLLLDKLLARVVDCPCFLVDRLVLFLEPFKHGESLVYLGQEAAAR